jgi:hypothetical protein
MTTERVVSGENVSEKRLTGRIARENIRCRAIADGIPVPDLARATYGEKP